MTRKIEHSIPKRSRFSKKAVLVFVGALILGVTTCHLKTLPKTSVVRSPRCGKIDAIAPNFDKSIETIFHDPIFREESLAKFRNALQIPTEIQDNNPKPSENLEYYSEFFKFHDYLEKAYPLVHKHLTLEKVNDLNLLYTWEGKNTSLKPMMITAHQDVVPVNRATVDQWTYPPFSGHYDNETDFVWGRGSTDCKNLLTADLQAVEKLLEDGFEPERTVLLAFGFDEETSGHQGAKTMGKFIHERYGDYGIYSIVDEGNFVVEVAENVYVAAPITGEKGFADVEFTIHGHGGHSSVPPDHTTIGIAAELIHLIESHPGEYTFTPANPFYGLLTCSAEHSDLLSQDTKSAILGAPFSKKDEAKLIEYVSGTSDRELLRTSQAIDIIRGGIKANALPEVTSFLMNHRIDINSSVNKTLQRDMSFVEAIARKFGYGVTVDGKEIIPATEYGYIEMQPKNGLEPAPLSPTENSPVWDLFAGTIQNVFENGFFKDEPVDFYVTTSLSSANTDTQYYWPLTKNIYRFNSMIAMPNLWQIVHSVDEHLPMSAYLSEIAFLYEYIVNVSENA